MHVLYLSGSGNQLNDTCTWVTAFLWHHLQMSFGFHSSLPDGVVCAAVWSCCRRKNLTSEFIFFCSTAVFPPGRGFSAQCSPIAVIYFLLFTWCPCNFSAEEMERKLNPKARPVNLLCFFMYDINTLDNNKKINWVYWFLPELPYTLKPQTTIIIIFNQILS